MPCTLSKSNIFVFFAERAKATVSFHFQAHCLASVKTGLLAGDCLQSFLLLEYKLVCSELSMYVRVYNSSMLAWMRKLQVCFWFLVWTETVLPLIIIIITTKMVYGSVCNRFRHKWFCWRCWTAIKELPKMGSGYLIHVARLVILIVLSLEIGMHWL